MAGEKLYRVGDGQSFVIKTVPADEAGMADKAGWTPATPEDVANYQQRKEAGTVTGQIKTGAENLAAGAFDAATAAPRLILQGEYAGLNALTGQHIQLPDLSGKKLIENVAGIGAELTGNRTADAASREYAQGARTRAQENPWTAGGAYIGGQILGAAGIGAGAKGIGALATKGLGGGVGARLLGAGVTGALEGAPLNMVAAEDAAYNENRQLTGQQALASAGIGALLGGSLSFGAKGLGELAGAARNKLTTVLGAAADASSVEEKALGGSEASASRKFLRTGDETINKQVEQVTQRPVFSGTADYVRDGIRGSNLAEVQAAEQGAAARSVRGAVNEMETATKNLSPEWREAKAANVAKTIDKSEGALEAQAELAQNKVGEIRDRLAEMKADPAAYGDRATLNKLERHVAVAEREIGSAFESGSHEDMFVALDNLKRKMGPLARPGRMLSVASDAESAREVRVMYDGLRDTLTDNVWGGAGAMQRDVNGAYEKWLGTKRIFDNRFMSETGREGWEKVYGADPGKIEPYINGLGQSRNDLTHSIIEQHIQSTKDLATQLSKAGELTPEKAAELASVKNAAIKFEKTIGDVQQKVGAINQAQDFLTKAKGAAASGNTAILGGLVGGHLGAAAGFALEAATNPAKFLTQRIALEQMAERAQGVIGKSLDSLFTIGTEKASGAAQAVRKVAGNADAAAVPSLAYFMGKHGSPELAYEKRAQELYSASQDFGGGVRSAIGESFGPLAAHEPAALTSMTASATTGVNYLLDHLPMGLYQPNTLTPLTSKTIPSRADISTFARVYTAVMKPMTVMDDLAKGKATRDQIDAIQNVYPKLYDWMRMETMARIRDLDEKGKEIPWHQRMQLDVLLNLNGAGERTLTNDFVMSYSGSMSDGAQAMNQPKTPAPRPGPSLLGKSSQTMTSSFLGGSP